MYTVGRIGSYISRGVYTVSAPFHPFGGAVDIIVVEQPDGSSKSSPWYVRFGKFQGVLKTREKVVSINVDGVDANFNMYLDHKGEAYFLTEADVEEGESASCPSSSGDEADVQSNGTGGTMKSQSCSDADRLDSDANVDASDGKMSHRTNSQRARILGLVFGQKSFKSDNFQEGEGDIDMVRLSSLERAEIAADLLEVKWSTNLSSSKFRKEKVPQISAQDVSDDKMANNILVDNEEIHVDLSVHDFEQNRNDQSVLDMECGSHFEEIVSTSLSSSKNLESFVDEASIDISCLGTLEHEVESSTIGGSVLEKNCEFVAAVSGKNDELGLGKACIDEHEHQTCSDSEVRCGKEFDEHQSCEKKDVALSGSRIPTEIGSDRVQSFIYCKTSETSVVGLDGTNEKTQETLYLASRECGEDHVHLETVHVTTELPKDTDVEKDQHIELVKELGKVPENHSDQVDQASCVLESETDRMEPPQAPESSTGGVRTESELSSIKEVNNLHRYLESTGESQDLYSDCVLKEAVGNSPSECSEDEQFLFSDLDESKLRKVQVVEPSSVDTVQKRDLKEFSAEDIKKIDGSVNANDESSSSLDIFGLYNPLIDIKNPTEKLRAMSNPIVIHKSNLAAEEVRRSTQSLPNMRSPAVNLDAHDPHHPLSLPLESNSKSMKWALFKKTESSWMKPHTDREELLAMEPSIEDPQLSLEQETVILNPTAGDLAKTNVSPGGSWRLWPFFRRSTCDKAMQPVMSDSRSADAEIASASISDRNTTESLCEPKVVKKKIRVLIPSSEQLASLNLKEGKNSVTFAFSTAMLGKQEVDARIYLWKWNTRIVISDVDGTITKSDVLGQFMPLVGVDWLQTGVAHLFSAIKENGYQLLFLSARAIAQAYHTRRFLLNLKQDGKALPDGPVVISPDGLFPSLFREVIRRAPHEFKISCLEDIKSLFPSDCNPFYAGFGNRDTDEISYLKVGIPRGKIFIINPKGEVAVNRRVDHKTYTSLHALVHGMFPHTTSTEQEDFNEWNYWKLPLPEIDISRC